MYTVSKEALNIYMQVLQQKIERAAEECDRDKIFILRDMVWLADYLITDDVASLKNYLY